ncbi:MAG: GH36 C-terminal domain-containing protein [Armatimonadota bacterium]
MHHILPRPDGVNWDGIFYYSEDCKRGVLYIFRPDSGDDVKTLKLKGLDENKTYKVWSEDGSVSAEKLTGAALMDNGLAIRLPDRHTSDLIYIDEAGRTP